MRGRTLVHQFLYKKPGMLVVRIERAGFLGKVNSSTKKIRVDFTSSTEAHLTIPNPHETEVVTLTDPVTNISVSTVVARQPLPCVLTSWGCRYHNLTGSRLMANRSPSTSCRLSAITRQPVLCMCQTSLSTPALCAWGLWGSKPGSEAVGFRSERGNGRPSSQLIGGRLLGLTV
jgi:hypothetical protein